MKKAFLAFLIIFFFLFYALLGYLNYANFGIINNGQDFDFHYKRINDISDNRFYSPLYHLIFKPLAFNQFAFYLANIILILAIVPLLIYLISKRIESVIIFFFGIPLAHMAIFSFIFPQVLIMIYFLIYLLFRKNWLIFIFLTILASFTHSKGFYLFLTILFLEIILIWLKNFKPNFKRFAVNGFSGVVFLIQDTFKLERLGFYLSVMLPIPLVYFYLRKFKINFYSGIFVISIITAILSDIRVLWLAELILCLSLGTTFKKMPQKLKIGFCLFLLANLAYFLIDYGLGTTFLIIKN